MHRPLYTFLLALCTLFASAQGELEKVAFSFSGFKRPKTKFEIDYGKRELTCTHFGYQTNSSGKFNKTYTFSEAEFARLKSELSKDVPQKDSTKSFEMVLDGGGFRIQYQKHGTKPVTLHVLNPERYNARNKSDFEKLEAFFDFAYSVVKDPDGIRTLDESFAPYFRGAPIRKVSDKPLEYYIWGEMSGDYKDNKDFFVLLDSLSGDGCVILDCRGKLCIALEEAIFVRYILKSSNIRFVNMETLARRRSSLEKMKNELQKPEANRDPSVFYPKGFNYRTYLNYPEEVDDWLALPESRAIPKPEEARDGCR